MSSTDMPAKIGSSLLFDHLLELPVPVLLDLFSHIRSLERRLDLSSSFMTPLFGRFFQRTFLFLLFLRGAAGKQEEQEGQKDVCRFHHLIPALVLRNWPARRSRHAPGLFGDSGFCQTVISYVVSTAQRNVFSFSRENSSGARRLLLYILVELN